MKNLIILFYLIMSLNAKAQNYLNETARWNQAFSFYGSMYNFRTVETLYFNGDTLFNGKKYKLLYDSSTTYSVSISYDNSGQPYEVFDTSSGVQLKSLIREENKKIFSLEPGGAEIMSYNFGLSDYSSIDLVVPYNNCSLNQVNNDNHMFILIHDTICIGEIGRKRWSVNTSQYTTAYSIIEGVGSSSGFLAPFCNNGCPECSRSLFCFVMNGDTLGLGNCIIAENEETSKIQLIVNQKTDAIVFEGGLIEQMSIFNLSLQLVEAINIARNKMEFNTSFYSNGMYLFSGIFEGKQINGKFLIIGK